jgi:hypothetical protein
VKAIEQLTVTQARGRTDIQQRSDLPQCGSVANLRHGSISPPVTPFSRRLKVMPPAA